MNDLATSLLNKTDYAILESLAIRECNTQFYSVTIDQLINFTQLSKTKVRNALKLFLMLGLVQEGNKDKRNKTYYITTKGETHFLEVFGLTEDDLISMIKRCTEIENVQDECSISIEPNESK